MEAPLKAEGSAARPARPFAGVVANIAGFGDATEPGAVGRAVTMVYTSIGAGEEFCFRGPRGASNGMLSCAM
jgi:hypothetical protein